MSTKLILICLLITNIYLCHAAEYYDDYEEIPDEISSVKSEAFGKNLISFLPNDDEERKKMENDVIKVKLDEMSVTFKKIINKIKMKHKRIEMVFLVDSSSSVGKENFANEISFVKRLLSDFNVSFNYTRVALVTFSSRSKIQVHINQISEASEANDKCVMLNYQIPNITYSGGGTNTYGALLKAKEIFENSHRKNSKKLLVLITDGFSNGRNPIEIAEELKFNNITIFTVGISSGNLDELRSISSKPPAIYNYMLSSFSLFESLARKALHTDYKVGVILPVTNDSFCDSLCVKNDTKKSCCDINSRCACGFHSGHFSCICNPGYYGTGLIGSCDICPNGTYWNFWNVCFNCPDINHETLKTPALSVNDCVCKKGFRETQKHRCEVIKCPLLPVPENGYFVQSSSCLNTVNEACGARCKSGYQLVGSSIRLCQEDGTWSGQETECVLKTCPAILIPNYGTAKCKNRDLNLTLEYSPRNATFMKYFIENLDVQKFTENFPIDTECEFTCAYGYNLVGSQKRHCLPLSKWDGLSVSCKQILCQPLPKVPFGSYDLDECFKQKSHYGANCTFACNEGFELKGPSLKSCGGTRNGIWSQKSKTPKCVDVAPPNIVCPKNYSIEVVGNKSFILLSTFEPLEYVKDNSGTNVTFWVKPALKEGGTKMYAGNYTFTYVAVDEFKNKAKCNFTISIFDKTPPVFENCISEQLFYVSSKNNTNLLIEWEEPSAYDNVDDKNITIIKSLEHGFLNVGNYLVNYTAIDKTGNANQCLVNVTVKEKKCDDLEKPEHGQRLCAKNETMTWCDFRCNFGYAMMENQIVVENSVYFCNNENRTWSIETIPECTAVEQPNSAEEILTISLNSEGHLCEDLLKNQDQLIKDLKEDLCGDQECELTTDIPECINDGMSNEISNKSYYAITKRDTESKPHKKSGLKIRNPAKVELYVRIAKNLGMWRPNSTKSENIKHVKKELERVNTSERLKKRLRKMNIDLESLKLDEKVTCNPGSVSKRLICVQCPRGTFHDFSRNYCTPCQFGSYNSLVGQSTCEKCTEFHSTRKSGSRLSTDCRQMCPPGTYQRVKAPKKANIIVKTLVPFCRVCDIGEYQPDYDQSLCLKCPDGLTSDRGSKTIDSCYIKYESPCNETTCGDHGNCTENGAFYYCDCLDDYYGQQCELKQDLCVIMPCYNNGMCKHLNDTDVSCECQTGFNGPYCEFVDDPCSSKNCFNGASCHEIEGEAFCECLEGFDGDTCEHQIPIDYCGNAPCANGGTCINHSNGYECVCDAGTIGRRCHLTACDYKPCPENALCVNLQLERATKESYFCKCPSGLKGIDCDQIDNPCDKIPCKNHAECLPKALRNPLNFTVVENEEIFEEFSCKCPPFFYGNQCELFTTPDFVFEFERSSINNYVKLPGPEKDLNAISFCAWIQTKDQFNYGSIISYATKDQDNAFTFTDYNGFVLYVNGVNTITDIKIIDDIWHFLCLSWTMKDGSYQIYLDGTLNIQGYNLSKDQTIAGNGIFIIGQEQDSLGGGFSETESFVGKISYLDFWDRALSEAEISEYYRTCDPYEGNLYSWTDLKFKTVGDIKVHRSEFCKACDQNLTIDNGFIIYGDQTAFVKCNKGFTIIGNPFLFCLRTSKWETSNLPTCKIVKCGLLKTPTNGRMTLTKTTYTGRAKFICDDGFILIGNDTITCMANGNWSDNVPECKSIYECPALENPKKGILRYASDLGIIKEELSAYPVGTFVEIICNPGYSIDGENIISCTENGEWDFEVEDCIPDEPEVAARVDAAFMRSFKDFIFKSCNSASKPDLCLSYSSDFDTDLSTFDLPETTEYEGMDSKLLQILTAITSSDFSLLSIENFIEKLIYVPVGTTMRDSYRFAICLFIDLILMDDESQDQAADDIRIAKNINDKIKILLKRVLQAVYENHLKTVKK